MVTWNGSLLMWALLIRYKSVTPTLFTTGGPASEVMKNWFSM